MRFIVSTSELSKNLSHISGVISSNSVLPILENFLFDIKEGNMKIIATDMEITMTTSVNVECKEEGKVAIPARILLDTLKTLPEQPITFSVDESNYAIEIKSATGKYKLAGENPNDFPKLPVLEDVSEVNLSSEILGRAISNTAFATSSDELRPAMTGVFFQMEENHINFVATDASKLVKYSRKDVSIDAAASFIMPKKALLLVKGSLPSQDTSVNIAFNNTNAFFSFNNTQLICRLVDAKYPDYNAVIPAENNNILELNRVDFLNALKRVSIFSNKTTYQCILNISTSELKVSSQDLDFSNEAYERMACNYNGTDLEIAFNTRFLIEMLSIIHTEEVHLELSTPARAGILVPAMQDEGESLLMLVMPVMVN